MLDESRRSIVVVALLDVRVEGDAVAAFLRLVTVPTFPRCNGKAAFATTMYGTCATELIVAALQSQVQKLHYLFKRHTRLHCWKINLRASAHCPPPCVNEPALN